MLYIHYLLSSYNSITKLPPVRQPRLNLSYFINGEFLVFYVRNCFFFNHQTRTNLLSSWCSIRIIMPPPFLFRVKDRKQQQKTESFKNCTIILFCQHKLSYHDRHQQSASHHGIRISPPPFTDLPCQPYSPTFNPSILEGIDGAGSSRINP